MSVKARIKRLEKERPKFQPPEGYPDDWPWEAPMFVVWKEEDVPRVEAEREYWREEIERDKARGRTCFGFSFLHPDPEEAAAYHERMRNESETTPYAA